MIMGKSALNSKNRRRHKLALLALQGDQCFYCQDNLLYEDATIDHVIPVKVVKEQTSRDEKYKHINNTVVACFDCNQSKGHLTGEQFLIIIMNVHPPKSRKHLAAWHRRKKHDKS